MTSALSVQYFLKHTLFSLVDFAFTTDPPFHAFQGIIITEKCSQIISRLRIDPRGRAISAHFSGNSPAILAQTNQHIFDPREETFKMILRDIVQLLDLITIQKHMH